MQVHKMFPARMLSEGQTPERGIRKRRHRAPRANRALIGPNRAPHGPYRAPRAPRWGVAPHGPYGAPRAPRGHEGHPQRHRDTLRATGSPPEALGTFLEKLTFWPPGVPLPNPEKPSQNRLPSLRDPSQSLWAACGYQKSLQSFHSDHLLASGSFWLSPSAHAALGDRVRHCAAGMHRAMLS